MFSTQKETLYTSLFQQLLHIQTLQLLAGTGFQRFCPLKPIIHSVFMTVENRLADN